jgi:Flp pilus assembly protein TadD
MRCRPSPGRHCLNNLGVILARDRDSKGAIDQYQQAIAINPDYPEAHANLGHELVSAGQFEPARIHHLEAIRLKPDFAIALADLGLIDAAAGNYEEAIRRLNESLRLAPDDAEVHSNLCFALQHSGRREVAIVQCREALRLKPNDATHSSISGTRSRLDNSRQKKRPHELRSPSRCRTI